MTARFPATLALLLAPVAALADCPVTVEQMAFDMTRLHDAAPSGIPDSYDWQAGPRIGMGNTPGDFRALIAWGQVYNEAGQTQPANTRVEIGPLRALVLDPQTGQWADMHPQVPVDGAAYVEDFVDDAAIPADSRITEGAAISVRLLPGHNFHFWPDSGRVPVDPAAIGGIVVTVSARLILDDPLGIDDRSDARIMMSVGADFWRDMDAEWEPDFTANGDAAIGRFGWITQEWQVFSMTTLEMSSLCANPPPV